jgi:hypothetical protein
MKSLKYFFWIVDVGFVVYWLITALELIPAEYLYNDYKNPILVNWNWSFFPLDLAVSATGFYSLYLAERKAPGWLIYALISLVLTSVSGLQAIAYWVLAQDFDPNWWIPNLFLLIYPWFFIFRVIKRMELMMNQ